jgi:hypothetical protein
MDAIMIVFFQSIDREVLVSTIGEVKARKLRCLLFWDSVGEN